jgi:predicted nucleotidyltransferase
MNYTAETVTRYRESIRRHEEARIVAVEARRQKALSFAKELAAMLGLHYGANRVVLIGSTLDPRRFKESSDIDLVAYHIPKEKYFGAVVACMNADFNVDLIPFESAHELVLKSLGTGMVVYES